MIIYWIFIVLLSLPKTIYVNFRSLPFLQAIKMPLLIHYNTKLSSLSGIVLFTNPPKLFSVKLGFTGSFALGGINYWSNSGKIVFNGKASFARGTQIVCGDLATLCFGANFSSNSNCIFNAGKKVVFGDNCLLSWNISVLDGDGHKLIEPFSSKGIEDENQIIIGNHVWICMNSMILKGTLIKDNSVIGAGSIVSRKQEEPNLLIVGVNKVIKKQINWVQ